jgi:nitrate/nitrite transporter NarK
VGLPACASACIIPFFFPLSSCLCSTIGVYGAAAPFWALPNEFLAGFSAASGIALIATIGTVGGFFGSYAVGLIGQKTGSLFGGVTLAGVALLVLALLVLLLPPRHVSPK